MQKVFLNLVLISIILILLSGCTQNFDYEMEIVEKSNPKYIDGSDENPISINKNDENKLFISVHVTDEYFDLNKNKQWKELEKVVVTVGGNMTNTDYEQIYVTFYGEGRNIMNVFGERKIRNSNYKLWMTQYFDENDEPVFYPSYYDINAPL